MGLRETNGQQRAATLPTQAIFDRVDKLARDAGPKWGSIMLVLAGVGFAVLAVAHRSWDHAAFSIFSFGGAAGVYGTASRAKRTQDMTATGVAEIKDLITPPGVPPPPSADPAIDRAQVKIANGLPPTSSPGP